MLLRARLVSFFAGVGVAGSLALYQLRQEVWESHRILSQQVPFLLVFQASSLIWLAWDINACSKGSEEDVKLLRAETLESSLGG